MQPCVYIVMAIFRPNPTHLRAQIASLAAQTHRNIHLVAVIADTTSEKLLQDEAQAAGIAASLVVPDLELDAVRAFEAGLADAVALIDAEADRTALIALCDQDDIWHPDRLSRGIAALETSGVGLVHSDARLVGSDGETIRHNSVFAFERRHRKPGMRGLLYRNNITGMTTLMRPRVVRIALPFPPQSGVHFYHDLWLGLVAEAAGGGVQLINDSLADYRQHETNEIGAVDRRQGMLAGIGGRIRRINAMWVRREAASYGLARYLAFSLQDRLKETVAAGRLTTNAVRTGPLRPFLRRNGGTGAHAWDMVRLAVTGHPDLARIAGGFALISAGRLIWALRLALTVGLKDARERFDKTLFGMSPGVVPKILEDAATDTSRAQAAESLIDQRKSPRWKPVFTAESPALCILVPTLNPTEMFAGIVTALDIGLGLAERGYQVRFIATDLPVSSPGAARSFLLRRLSQDAAAGGAAGRVSVHCGVQTGSLAAHKGDVFLATAWWSAHVADKMIRDHDFRVRTFWYLIQDYEPNFYAWSAEYADALASYSLPFRPVFNTTLLRDYFALQGFDFATDAALAFHPMIDVSRYASGKRPDRDKDPRRLVVYGRPEVPRNLFPTLIETLSRFIETEQLGPQDIELISVGMRHAPVRLPRGLVLKSLGKLPWEDYPGFLLESDLGLSLMYSPHPSHPPIEMAASGARVVTNSFGPKDLNRISPAILSAAPIAAELSVALGRAWAMGPVGGDERRIDLTQLGLPPEEMLDGLAEALAQDLPSKRSTA